MTDQILAKLAEIEKRAEAACFADHSLQCEYPEGCSCGETARVKHAEEKLRMAKALRVAVEALQVAEKCALENRANGKLPSYESEIAEFALSTIHAELNKP